jgi:hypothetical protein
MLELPSYDAVVYAMSAMGETSASQSDLSSIVDSCLAFGCGEKFFRLIHAHVSGQAVSYVFKNSLSSLLTRSGVSPQIHPHRLLYHI